MLLVSFFLLEWSEHCLSLVCFGARRALAIGLYGAHRIVLPVGLSLPSALREIVAGLCFVFCSGASAMSSAVHQVFLEVVLYVRPPHFGSRVFPLPWLATTLQHERLERTFGHIPIVLTLVS